jgi:hypothetical protein
MQKLFQKIWDTLLWVFSPTETEMKYIPLTDETIEELKKQLEPTMEEKFLKVCLDALDTEVTPQDNVPDYVACAEVVSTLIKRVFPDFPIIPSTKDLDFKLFTDKRFTRITEPIRGCIIVSPKTNNTYGHVGVFVTNEMIASNTSKDGIFRSNYDWDSWIHEFKDIRGLKIYLYKLSL